MVRIPDNREAESRKSQEYQGKTAQKLAQYGPQAVRGRGHIPKPVNLKEIQTTLDEKVRTACAG